MEKDRSEWEDIGKNIESLIDDAISSHDYERLSQTVRKAVEKAADISRQSAAYARNSGTVYRSPDGRVSVEQRPLPALYGKTGKRTFVGILKAACGGYLSLYSLPWLVSTLISALVGATTLLSFSLIFSAARLGIGVWLLVSGIRSLQRLGRFRAYRQALGKKTYCALDKLARSVGKSVDFVRAELDEMISDGLFTEGHLDYEQRNLITSDETYRMFEASRAELEKQRAAVDAQKAAQRAQEEALRKAEAQPVTPEVQQVLDRGNAFLAELRRCNDAIPGEEISAKISRIELIVQKIFARARMHPEIIPDLKKLMDYYLPMTIKLLNAYAEMDAQPAQGETIRSSKREIEATLDTLNLALEKLLDSVFEDTAMDVSSDISVLNTLLAQEGLVDDELTRLKAEQNKQNQKG